MRVFCWPKQWVLSGGALLRARSRLGVMNDEEGLESRTYHPTMHALMVCSASIHFSRVTSRLPRFTSLQLLDRQLWGQCSIYTCRPADIKDRAQGGITQTVGRHIPQCLLQMTLIRVQEGASRNLLVQGAMRASGSRGQITVLLTVGRP